MALVNLVALIAAVSIHLYKSSTTSLGSHFINFYEQFAGQIETLRSRYMSVTMAISMHRLQGQTRDIVRGT
jgi:hypothetical protein